MRLEGAKCLVTGAAGFVGANLCRRLLDERAEVHALVKPSTASWRLDELASRIAVHAVDVVDKRAVADLVAQVRPSVVYHLAANGAYHYQRDAEQILLVNVLGSWNLLDACNRVGYELFVSAGSSSEYGPKQQAMRESDPLEPNSIYAVAKSAQSLLCRHVALAESRPIVALRLFSIYGPYEEPGRLIPNLMLSAIRDEPIELASPDIARDFTHVDDVVDLLLRVDRLKELCGEILNVGTGVQTCLRDLVDAMGVAQGRPMRANWGRYPARSWDTQTWVADVSRTRRLLGRAARTSVLDGLRQSLGWFREHQRFYRPS